VDWITTLQGTTVCLDTAPFIYFIEEHPRYLPTMQGFFEALDRGEFRVVTSTLTLLEVLVQPLRQGRSDLAELYRAIFLSAAGVEVVSITAEIAEKAAFLRAHINVSVPDAIQLAVAHSHGAAFFTNDRKIPSIPGLSIFVLEDLIVS
jgi:predicted nucleic acid-binding protein